jgi:hypothetical protein
MKNWRTVAVCTGLMTLLIACGGNPYTCKGRPNAKPGVSKARGNGTAADKKNQSPEATGVTPAPAPEAGSDTTSQNAVPDLSPSPWLNTKGNKIYTETGDIFRGRGANIHDTRSCNACTWTPPDVAEVKRRIDTLVDDWGANFLRLLVESYAEAQGRVNYAGVLKDPGYLQDLIEIIRYIGTKKNTYVLVSLWTEPTADKNGWPTEKTIPVWRTLAKALIQFPHVMFGVINEPHGNWNGENDQKIWKRMNDVVREIRAVEKEHRSPKHIVAVQGTRRFARHLGYYVDHPIKAGNGENIVYESHSYLRPQEFTENWAGPAEKIPVIIGEFGPADLGAGSKMTVEHTMELIDLAEKMDIPWLAWTFHMRCNPNLIEDNSGGSCGKNMKLVPTKWGKKIQKKLSTPWSSN